MEALHLLQWSNRWVVWATKCLKNSFRDPQHRQFHFMFWRYVWKRENSYIKACVASNELPQVMSLKSVLVVAEGYQWESETKFEAVELERPKCRWLSGIVGNVGARFWRRRMCGIKKHNISDPAVSSLVLSSIVHFESFSVTGMQCCSL